MKRFCMLLCSALFVSNACAEWSFVNGDGAASQYVDRGRIQRSGDLSKIWVGVDYVEPRTFNGVIFNSVVVQEEYDCENELRRTRFVTLNSGRMFSGENLASDPAVTNWNPIPPGSAGDMFLKIACD